MARPRKGGSTAPDTKKRTQRKKQVQEEVNPKTDEIPEFEEPKKEVSEEETEDTEAESSENKEESNDDSDDESQDIEEEKTDGEIESEESGDTESEEETEPEEKDEENGVQEKIKKPRIGTKVNPIIPFEYRIIKYVGPHDIGQATGVNRYDYPKNKCVLIPEKEAKKILDRFGDQFKEA